jgi:hypothetical protein
MLHGMVWLAPGSTGARPNCPYHPPFRHNWLPNIGKSLQKPYFRYSRFAADYPFNPRIYQFSYSLRNPTG